MQTRANMMHSSRILYCCWSCMCVVKVYKHIRLILLIFSCYNLMIVLPCYLCSCAYIAIFCNLCNEIEDTLGKKKQYVHVFWFILKLKITFYFNIFLQSLLHLVLTTNVNIFQRNTNTNILNFNTLVQVTFQQTPAFHMTSATCRNSVRNSKFRIFRFS